MRLLYVGESWLGSCARSLREAIARRHDVIVDDVGEDAWFTKPRAKPLRALCRLTNSAYRRELERHLWRTMEIFKPQVIVFYKGSWVTYEFIVRLRQAGLLTANVYPDNSPHAHGAQHKRAVGAFDIVLSSKMFHPASWQSVYGYDNECRFVAQGYDPLLHLHDTAPVDPAYDIALAATYRPEYGNLMTSLCEQIGGLNLRGAIAGNGWSALGRRLPGDWTLIGPVHGRSYAEVLRSAKVCIAPVTREVHIDGRAQPGDEDTTRTYELAAARCFFVHRRTDRVRELYDEATEVPMYDNASELAEVVRRFLGDDPGRARMARAAHARAVPAYSLDARAEEIVGILDERLRRRSTPRVRSP